MSKEAYNAILAGLEDALRYGERDDEPWLPIRLGKYMTARPLGMDPEVYTVHARNGSSIGYVEWYAPWRGYVFRPDDDTEFSFDCLEELARFVANCTQAKKAMEINRPLVHTTSNDSDEFERRLVRWQSDSE